MSVSLGFCRNREVDVLLDWFSTLLQGHRSDFSSKNTLCRWFTKYQRRIKVLRKEGKESLQSKKVQAIMRKKIRIEQKAYL